MYGGQEVLYKGFGEESTLEGRRETVYIKDGRRILQSIRRVYQSHYTKK